MKPKGRKFEEMDEIFDGEKHFGMPDLEKVDKLHRRKEVLGRSTSGTRWRERGCSDYSQGSRCFVMLRW